MGSPKFKLKIKSRHWDSGPGIKVSQPVTARELVRNYGTELTFSDGGTLPLNDLSYSLDKIDFLSFTGFHDTYGREIYEDDIVEKRGVRFRVIQVNNAWGVRSKSKAFTRLHEGSARASLIVGNIHENPELFHGEN